MPMSAKNLYFDNGGWNVCLGQPTSGKLPEPKRPLHSLFGLSDGQLTNNMVTNLKYNICSSSLKEYLS